MRRQGDIERSAYGAAADTTRVAFNGSGKPTLDATVEAGHVDLSARAEIVICDPFDSVIVLIHDLRR